MRRDEPTRARRGEGDRATIEGMVDDFYTLLSWPDRSAPTASIPIREVLLLRHLVSEEIFEFVGAVEARNIVKIADAVADIAYVAYGAGRQYRIEVAEGIAIVFRARAGPLDSAAGMPPTVEVMAREWYRLEGWPVRAEPTAEIDDDEIAGIQRALSVEEARFVAASEERSLERLTIAIAGIALVTHLASLHFGFDLTRVVQAVHQANLSKRSTRGTMDVDEATGKVLRGPRYRPPDIASALWPEEP